MSNWFTDASIAEWLLIGARECVASAEWQRARGDRERALAELRLHVGRRELGRQMRREAQVQAAKP